jgi:hypothetical protein
MGQEEARGRWAPYPILCVDPGASTAEPDRAIAHRDEANRHVRDHAHGHVPCNDRRRVRREAHGTHAVPNRLRSSDTRGPRMPSVKVARKRRSKVAASSGLDTRRSGCDKAPSIRSPTHTQPAA